MYRDAKKRNYDILGAVVLGFSLGIIGLIIWFFIRPKTKGELKKMNIIVKIALLVITTLNIIIVLLIIVYQPIVQVGGSMLPTLNNGDMVFFRSNDNLNIGDIAVYEPPNMNYDIVHRIVDIKENGYIFKGDNNMNPDPFVVARERIKGKVDFSIPLIGYPRIFLYELGM